MPKVSLHPSVRERNEPRLSANQLAEYITFGIERAENIIHDAKFLQAFIPTWYEDSSDALTKYLADPLRKKSNLYDEVERLQALAKSTHSEDEGDRALLDIRIIERFLVSENSLGLNKFAFVAPPKSPPLKIEGVLVSVKPNLLIHPLEIAKKKRVGGIIFRLSKSIDHESAKKESTIAKRKDLRREMGAYVAMLLAMNLEKHLAHLGSASSDHCLAVDVPLGEAIPVPSNPSTRLKTIKKACRQIAQTWPNIAPKPSITVS
jgi:hypothetical protein